MVDEVVRMEALEALRILDTEPEPEFDDIARLATRLCQTPVALVSFVATDRQWFKARVGFAPCETDLDRSVCKLALAQPDLLIIPDLSSDPRTAANPLVTAEPHIRFYAGAPLRMSNGSVVGSLCVIDTASRPEGLTADQADDLRALGRQVIALLEARGAAHEVRAGAKRESEAQASAIAQARVSEAQNVALRASDERGRMAQEAGGVGLYELDVASGMMQVSPEFCRLFGVPVAPIYTASTFEAFVVAEDAGIRSDESRRRDGSAVLDVEYRIRRGGEGEIRWIARRASFDRDASGAVTKMFGTVRDITERRAMQDALSISEARFRSLFENIDAGFCICEVRFDEDGRPVDHRVLAANPAFERHTGLTNVVGRWANEIAPGIEQHWHDAYGQVAKTGETLRFEGEAAPLGRWYDAHLFPAGDGRVAMLIADVTERRQKDAALQASQQAASESAKRVQLALAAGAIIGTWNWDVQTDRFTIDDAFASSFGLDAALGRDGIPLHQIVATVHPDDQTDLARAIEDAIQRGGSYAHQYRVRRTDGRYYWIEANGRVDTAPDGTPVSFPGVLLDVEDRREAEKRRAAQLALGDRLRDLTTIPEMTAAAAEIVGTTLAATRAGYGRVDPDIEFIDIEPGWNAPGVVSIAGRHRFADYGNIREDLRKGEPLVIEDVRTDPRTRNDPEPMLALGIGALVNMPVMDRGRTVAVFIVQSDEARAWTPETLGFLRNVAERLEAGVARVRAEEDQRLLNEEISHRLKNTLAMVLSIATQTLRSVPDKAPVEAFEKRIYALSSAHDILLKRVWTSAPLEAVAKAVLGNIAPLDRFDIGGPSVHMGPRATLSVSLLMHELVTNAVKYGALSNDTGRAAISWSLEGATDEEELKLVWAESGGPIVEKPSRRGFGSRLIRMGLVGTGASDLSYLSSGLRAELRAPLAHIRQS